jgi:hypothetical protein
VKKSTLLTTISLSLLGFALQGCSSEEEIPALPTPATTVAEPVAKTVAAAEPELKPIAPAATEPASISPPTVPGSLGTTGNYVIQVGIQPSEKGANKIAGKLSESGITSYLARVENPGELEGTYYRVRIGYFETKAAAEQYAKNVLEPQGFAWWIDSRRNDEVGNPSSGTSDNSGSYNSGSNTTTYSYPAPSPAPAPEPAPVQTAPAADEGWNTPAAQPAAPMPAAPPQSAPAVVDNGWE